jgi:pyruvate,water dikinase
MAAMHAQAIPAIAEASETAARAWLQRGIAAWSESLYRQTLVTMGAVQPVADQLITLADTVGISGQELMAGYGGHEETRAVNDAWACSRDRLELATFIQRHGYHGWRSGELSSKVWREDHSPVHKLIDGYRAKSDDADPEHGEQQRMKRRRELEAAFLRALPATRRPRGRLVLELAARYVPLRGVGKVSFLRGVDIARAASRRLGVLLAQDGRLQDPEDVFYLTRDELLGTWPSIAQDLVASRRERRTRYDQLAIPQSFRGVAPTTTPEIDSDTETIDGTAAGPGVVEGLARVITNPDDAHVEEGEILIAHDTDPSWASLMFLSAGLVADIGGIMSHTAVVARELAIPCVVNTKHATRTLKTGDRIRLDGTRGQVHILHRAGSV